YRTSGHSSTRKQTNDKGRFVTVRMTIGLLPRSIAHGHIIAVPNNVLCFIDFGNTPFVRGINGNSVYRLALAL
ncbi:MAG: hypothetical protein ACRDHN_11905, partial [Thermomicrobiales bacterium]